MNDEAASEWLKNAGDTIGQMRNTYLAILIFALTVGLTLLTQHWQIAERETKYQQIHTTRSHSWNKLGLLYAEFPSDFTQTEVAPLYRVAVRSVIWTTFLGGSVDKNGENKKFEAALESMSQAVQRLRDYNSDLRAVDGARRLMMPFDHLDASTLASVVHVSSFKVDDKFCEGLGSIEGIAYAAWKSYAAQKKDLVRNGSTPENPFDRVSPQCHLSQSRGFSFTPQFYEGLGEKLPKFETLDARLAADDYGQFENSKLSDADRTTLLADLKQTSFTNLADLKQQEAVLEDQIYQAKHTSVKIPVLDLTLDMRMFGGLSAVLNGILLAWVAYLLWLLQESINHYRALAADYNTDLVSAIAARLPFSGGRNIAIGILNVLVICLPGVLGTSYYMWSTVHASQPLRFLGWLSLLLPALALLVLASVIVVVAGRIRGQRLALKRSQEARSSTPL